MQLDLDFEKTLQAGKRQFHLRIHCRSDFQRMVFYGPSGAGKSLTLKAIAGLLTPDRGHIRLNGVTLFDSQQRINVAPQARRLGYVFQDYALFPHLNVQQNIQFGLTQGWLNPRRHQPHQEVERWLETMELGAVKHQLPSELSGGQRQRTALARALVSHPQALLLDEPFAALDPELRQSMRQALDRLQQRLQVPMILITHDPEDRTQFGDCVVRLEAGQVCDPAVLPQEPHR